MWVVMTLTLGSSPRQKHGKVRARSVTRKSHLHFQECEGMNPHIPNFGSWNPYRILNFQRGIQGSTLVEISQNVTSQFTTTCDL